MKKTIKALFRLGFVKSGRKVLLILIDMTLAVFTYITADILFSLTSARQALHLNQKLAFAGMFFLFLFVFRCFLGIYSSVWRYANSYAFIRLIVSDTLAGTMFFIMSKHGKNLYFTGWTRLSLICMVTLMTLLSRFIYQLWHSRSNSVEKQKDKHKLKNAAIIGAGQIGAMLANEMRVNYKSIYNPYCFVDVDKSKIGNNISGVKVLDAKDNIIEKLKRLPIEVIIIALPKIEGAEKERIFNYYKKTKLPIKIYDFTFYDSRGDLTKRVIRDIKIEDLLFREPVSILSENTESYYRGKRILITGGGGSIGSELCRQIAKCGPQEIVIIDNYENNAHEITQELRGKYKSRLNLFTEIASVRDLDKLRQLFQKYKPQIVFHAAAHKHVYLMENSPSEAIKNNVFGTKNTADLADKYGAEKFILVSTDKAVNPTNVMGASKRLCEMIVQSKNESKTSFAAVRFGNVLGSNGSVLHTFKQQIDKGGPVTVTDNEVIRYFMTIPEAVQLVMETGVMAKRGELFVLDMGNPVRILDLAENMIRLSGYIPYDEIDIIEIGLRPGEKLYEELLIKKDGRHTTTGNKKIFVEVDAPISETMVGEKLDLLKTALLKEGAIGDKAIIKKALKEVVTTYCDPDEINRDAKKACEAIKICGEGIKEYEPRKVPQPIVKAMFSNLF